MKASLRSRQVPKHDRGVGRQGHRRCRLRPPHNTWPRDLAPHWATEVEMISFRAAATLAPLSLDWQPPLDGRSGWLWRTFRPANTLLQAHSVVRHGDRSFTDCALFTTCAPPPQYFTSCIYLITHRWLVHPILKFGTEIPKKM